MDFIFQTDFSDFTLKVLGRRFKLVEGYSIQMVIWMGHIHNLPLRDRYFVFTKQGLYWNFPAIVQSGEEGQTAERTICNSDFFQKQDSSFSLVFTKFRHLRTTVISGNSGELDFLFPRGPFCKICKATKRLAFQAIHLLLFRLLQVIIFSILLLLL